MTKWSNLLVFAPQDLPATVFLTEIQYLIYSPLFPGIVLLLWPCQGNLRRTCWAVSACQVGRGSRISQQQFFQYVFYIRVGNEVLEFRGCQQLWSQLQMKHHNYSNLSIYLKNKNAMKSVPINTRLSFFYGSLNVIKQKNASGEWPLNVFPINYETT